MTGGFLGSFSGALDGVTEAEAEAVAHDRLASTNSDVVAGGDVVSGTTVVSADANAPIQPHAAEEPAPSTMAADAEAKHRDVSPELRSVANAFLAGTPFQAATTTAIPPTAPTAADAPATGAQLWVHTASGARQVLYGEPILVGRGSPAADVAFLEVSNDKVSREHCGVRVVDGQAVCSDLGSTNGTWILRGDRAIAVHAEPVPLQPGDRITTMVNQVVIAEIRGTADTQ